MTDLPLKIRGFSRPELVQYIHAQIKAVVSRPPGRLRILR